MAAQKKRTSPAPSKNSFATSILNIGYRFPVSQVFDDFLTMSIAACTQNLATKVSYYEEEYLQVVAKYKDSDLRHEFSAAFAYLIQEMEERVESSIGNDVLGEFFELHISNSRNGQFFTPFPVCMFMASITHTDIEVDASERKPLRIIDPSCGSGRMLLASRKRVGIGHEYYGIDIDPICAKMTAINLFLNGMWNSQVMCANALSPNDFVIAYNISLVPLGIFKITEKEKSRLWQMHSNCFTKSKENEQTKVGIQTPFAKPLDGNATQLDLF